MLKFICCFFLMLSVVSDLEAKSRPSQPNLAILYDQLLAALNKGGNIIYVAQADTIGRPLQQEMLWWKNCSPEHRLSDVGIQQATTLGKAIHRIGFRYYAVRVSEACINLEMAGLIFRSPDTIFERTSDLNPADYQRREFGYSNEIIKLQIRGAILPIAYVEENSFVIAHPQPVETALHPIMTDLKPGESAIFSVTVTGELQLRARLNPEQWSEMAMYARPKKNRNQR